MASQEEGYDERRLEKPVDKNLHCPICMNVLKEPVQCIRNQHYFCRPCITRHLEHCSQTCPMCQEQLTTETLAQPPRILTDLLSALKIRCDYFERGCAELIELDFLSRHVVNCGYSPILCGNDGCLETVNMQDKEHHETELCEFRVSECQDCGEGVLYKKRKTHGCELRREVDEIKVGLAGMRTNLNEHFDMVRNQMKRYQDELTKEVKKMIAEVRNDSRTATNEAVGNLRTDQGRMRDETSATMAEMKEEVKAIRQVVENHSYFNPRGDILVAGGHDGDKRRLNSVEIFSWEKRSWLAEITSMRERRSVASVFVYQNEVFVTGGWTGNEYLCTTEKMGISPPEERWRDGIIRLPFKSRGHKTIVYQHDFITIGGYDADTQKPSGAVYMDRLSYPSSSKLLATLPQPRLYHGCELFGDKILIFGGISGRWNRDSVDTVVLYDLSKNSWKNMPPLLFPVYGMATVAWQHGVMIIGGADSDGKPLNTAFVYDIMTGRNEMLPPMRYCRVGCVAVVTGNTVVVMGGHNEEEGYLNTVESFSFDRYVWEDLPPMNGKRSYPVAVVMPVL